MIIVLSSYSYLFLNNNVLKRREIIYGCSVHVPVIK